MVFTDLVGSTELMARLGDAAFDRLRGEHFARLRDAVTAAGGEVVKTTGDGLLATFSSAVDALAATVAAQQATDRHRRSAGVPLSVRVGVSVGEVAFEDGDVFGTPVVEAARLVATAAPGQILATAVVRAVAGSRSPAGFTDRGPVTLKGLTDPVPVCEVTWEPSAAALPLPPLLTGTGRIFVGRGDELERLGRLWKETAAGERHVALLAGEPGIGKTRLAAELARGVHDDGGGVVLAGRCDQDLGVPYQPFVEALRHYVAHASEARLGRHGGELARLVPELTEMVPALAEPLRSDPETERYRLFDAVAGWLADASAEAPVLLVLDDLHWAAKPTVLLLRHVVRFAGPLRLMVVVTYRDSEVGPDHPLFELVADLRAGDADTFPLAGLDQAAVAAFIEAAAGHALSDEDQALPRAVWAETDGHPFFVAEVLRHLTESGGVEYRDGRWVVTTPIEELGIPQGVRDVLGRRLARLSANTNQVLGVASVVGLEFEPAVVRAAGALADDALIGSLEEAVAARLLTEVSTIPPRYRFAHALVRAALYDQLLGARRAVLHRRVAEAIEAVHGGALDDHLPALARHWARAAEVPLDTLRAVEYAARAGDRALDQLAHDEAVAYYRQALDLFHRAGETGDEGRRLELLLALGEAQRRAGDRSYRETLLEAARLARTRGDASALTRAALANSRTVMAAVVGSVDLEAVEVLEGALGAAGEEDTATRARLLATLAVEIEYAGDWQRCRALIDEALAVARRVGDPGTLALVLMSSFAALAGPGTLSDFLARTDELLVVASRLDDPVVRSRASALRGRAAMQRGDLDEAGRHLAQAETVAADVGQPMLRWWPAYHRTGVVVAAGRLDEGQRQNQQTFELGQTCAQPEAWIMHALHEFSIRRETGRDLDHVESLMDEAVTKFGPWSAVPGIRALLACELGRPDDARRILKAETSFGQWSTDHGWLTTLTSWAAVCAHLGDAGRAARLYNLLAAYPEQLPAAGGCILESVQHALALLAGTLGRTDEAIHRFGVAEDTYARAGAPIWLARVHLDRAGVLLARHRPADVEEARELLGRVLATARDRGLAGLERRAVALLP